MKIREIINYFKKHSNTEDTYGMERFGIKVDKAFGTRMPDIRKLGKKIGKNHKLALKLWGLGYRETKILAGLIADPDKVDDELMDSWVKDFDSWEVCDQVCMNLFDKVDFAFEKAIEYTEKGKEYVKRTGFALMACLAVHDKKSKDRRFLQFFPYIKKECKDGRNYVRKAVNWALRQIGKRNLYLNEKAIELAEEIYEIDDKTAKWIAGDALRELKSESVQKRLRE